MTTSILPSDIICATLRQRGVEVASLQISGVNSLAEILRRIPAALRGLTTIDLRNRSQGWQQRRTVMLRPVA